MVAVVRMRDKGMTISEIARRLRISKDRICSAINAAGVSGSSRRRTKEYWLRIDWKSYDGTPDVEALKTIIDSTPTILQRIEEIRLKQLRFAAGMMQLWGTNTA